MSHRRRPSGPRREILYPAASLRYMSGSAPGQCRVESQTASTSRAEKLLRRQSLEGSEAVVQETISSKVSALSMIPIIALDQWSNAD